MKRVQALELDRSRSLLLAPSFISLPYANTLTFFETQLLHLENGNNIFTQQYLGKFLMETDNQK